MLSDDVALATLRELDVMRHERGALVVRVDGQLVVARGAESRIRRRSRIVPEPPQGGSDGSVDVVVTDKPQGQAAPCATASMSAAVKVGNDSKT